MKRLLFLDIDGVLNRQGTNTRVEMDMGTFIGLEPSLLNKFIDWWQKRSDLEIILSSMWRTDRKACQHLVSKKITWIDVTPGFPGRGRGWEIKHSVEQHKPDLFAILDDISDMRPLNKYLVQTSERWGLQDKHLKHLDILLKYQEQEADHAQLIQRNDPGKTTGT